MKQLFALFVLVAISAAAPSGTISGSAEIEGSGIPQFITFDKAGNVGVNFGGYRASAGLGGLLTGNTADGGLHAEAGTPFGQAAGAGLGGAVDANGRSAGGLYAGATAGGGVSAGAGLAGTTVEKESTGGAFAGATVGAEKETHITKVAAAKPAALTFHKHIEVGAAAPAVVVHKEKEIVTEKHVEPQYVEKVIHVPSYVEKTIRVPTVVEKTVKVPVVPVQPEVASVNVDARVGDDVGVYKVVQKVRTHHHRPHFHKFKYFSLGGGVGGGNVDTAAGSAAGGAAAGGGATGTYTIRKQANPQFFNDIFNIPISTLAAVNQLVNGIAAGTSGSVSVSKSFGATKI